MVNQLWNKHATGEPPYCIWRQPMRILIGRKLSQASNCISAAAAAPHAAPAATEVHAAHAADADAAGKGDITLQKLLLLRLHMLCNVMGTRKWYRPCQSHGQQCDYMGSNRLP